MPAPKRDQRCDVLLVQPKSAHNMNIRFLPFGLLFLAGALRRQGFAATVVDLNVDTPDKLYQSLKNDRLLYVGFSVITGPMILDALAVSSEIRRRRPGLPIVWGGPHPTIVADSTAADPAVDLVAVGEGDRTAVSLARAYSEKTDIEQVPGLVFYRNGALVRTGPAERLAARDQEMSMELDRVDLNPYTFQNRGKKAAYVLTSRGCPFRCAFCWNVSFHDRHYRGWDVEFVWRELKPLFREGVQKLFLFDSFVGPVKRVAALGEMFKAEGIAWAIEDGCRVDIHGDSSLYDLLEASGCTHICFGAESGSQRILDLIDKDIQVEDIARSAEKLCGRRLGGRYQWMVGVPGETEADVLDTLNLIDRIDRTNPNIAHSIELYAPYPGNALYDRTVAAGWQPPQSLRRWGQYRWEGRYPHHYGNTWFFKAVQYSNMFYRFKKISQYSAYATHSSVLFRLAALGLYPLAALRYRSRFFDIPIEYRAAESARRIFEAFADRL